ncbi:MAG: SBBP repeat-containing protein [Candidatus Aminicenantales bacterium]
MDRAIAYYVKGREKTIYFTAEGLTFVLANDRREAGGSPPAPRWVVKLDFVDAKKGVMPVGLEKSGTSVSYFKGKPEDWKAGLAACSKLVYRDLWPGIDLLYSGTFNRMKYEFVVRPGADPSTIGLAYRGAEKVTLMADGRLAVQTPAGGFEDDAPIAYQDIDGVRRNVPVTYDLESATYGFIPGAYDLSRTLVIDPSSLIYCGFIGGQASDSGSGIAVDGDGSAYVVGFTVSDETTFPATVGPDLNFNGVSEDAFIAKVSPDGARLVYCGYIGGSASDRAQAVAVDALGSAYITGYTYSAESTFPVMIGPDLTHNGARDAFVAKVNPSGTALVFCGYVGGAWTDFAMGIAVDGLGNAHISGTTDSDETTFPVKGGPDLTYNGGFTDAFVAKVDSSGTALVYCGYIGGLKEDYSHGIAVDGLGNAYVSGTTNSSELEGFPVTVGPGTTFRGDFYDNFVAKVSSSRMAFDYCGYVSGGLDYSDAGIAVDSSGSAYIAGNYYSSELPAEVAVIKVNPSGTAVVYGRTIGGLGEDRATGIAVDASGNVYVVGYTNSEVTTFPETVGPGLVRRGAWSHDVFVAKIDPSREGPLVYCGFIGGDSDDHSAGIAVDGSGNAYVVGTTTDGDWAHFPTIAGPDLIWNGGDSDVFVAKVPPVPAVSNPTLVSIRPTAVNEGDPTLTLTLEGSDFVYGAYALWNGSPRSTTFVSDSELTSESGYFDLSEGGGLIRIDVRNTDGEITNPLWLTVNNPVPTLDSLSPAAAVAGLGSASFQLLGSNFVRTSIVRWNGAVQTPDYVSSTTLESSVPPAALAAGGEFQVAVENSEPGGGVTASLVFRIATFTLSATTTSATVNAGQSAAYTIVLTPQYGSFDAPVTFACAGLPQGCSASFSPSTSTPGASTLNAALTLKTNAPSGSSTAAALGSRGFFPPALSLLLVAVAFLFRPRPPVSTPASKVRRWLTAGALALIVLITASCGAGGSRNPTGDTGTPSGTYQITVQGKSRNLTVTTPVTLIVR